jgi:hypothetical protein
MVLTPRGGGRRVTRRLPGRDLGFLSTARSVHQGGVVQQRNLDFRHVSASLRPPRFALGYRVQDDWVYEARRANAVLARVWGGAGDILVPVAKDSGTAAADLLPLLRLYDPDYVGGHMRTVGDLGQDPDTKAKIIAKHRFEGESEEQTWSRLRLERLINDNWDDFAAQVDAWCSPYRGTQQESTTFRPQHLDWPARNGQSRRHLLTVPVTPEARVIVFDLTQVDPLVGLMVETRIGSVDEVVRDDSKIVRIPVNDDDLPKLITLAITGTTTGWELHDRNQDTGGPLSTPEPSSELTISELMADSPYGHTARWTTSVTSAYEPPVVCVIGDQPEDHALAVMADRIFRHGAWVPKKILGSERSSVVKLAIHRLGDLTEDHDQPVLVTSVSEDLETIGALVAEINTLFEMRSVPDGAVIRTGSELRAVAPKDLLEQQGRSWLADPTAFSVRRTLPVAIEGSEVITLAPLQLPLPDVALSAGVDVHWQVDVSLPGFQSPARTAIPSKVFLPSPVTTFPDAVIRTGRTGLSFASPNMGFTSSGDPVESRLAQPQLRFPTADDLFHQIAARSGARIERSDAGRRAQNALDMWGSFSAIAKDLTGTPRKVLDFFLPPGGKKNGDYGHGYAIRSEGYVSLEDIVEHAELAVGDARQLVDRLLLIDVVRRGFLLNCARCRWEAFYRIEQVGPTFPCHACGHTSALIHGRWYEEDAEPHVYYALDQVVRDLLNQHGYLPILAAAQLGKDARSVLWSSEFIVIDGNDSIELDLCLVVDGSIIVGEAKSNGILKAGHGTQEAAKRLVSAAQILTADKVVLATSKDHWTNDTYHLVAEAIETNWLRGPKPRLVELVRVGAEN